MGASDDLDLFEGLGLQVAVLKDMIYKHTTSRYQVIYSMGD